MFKYPLAVTIDTNIFDAAKFDLCDTSPLKTLENYVQNGKIKVVLSNIVVQESKRHIADQVKKTCGIMRKARADALAGSTEHLISSIGLGEILRIVTNKDALISKSEEKCFRLQFFWVAIQGATDMRLKNIPSKMMKKKFVIWTEKHFDSGRSEAMNHT